MTDEQIKQNAEDYIDENTQGVIIDTNIRNFLLDVYLAGAHSRNEEIEELRKILLQTVVDLTFLNWRNDIVCNHNAKQVEPVLSAPSLPWYKRIFKKGE